MVVSRLMSRLRPEFGFRQCPRAGGNPRGDAQGPPCPAGPIITRSGIDFVTVEEDGKSVERAVILGETLEDGNAPMVEVLTGLKAGDAVVTPK